MNLREYSLILIVLVVIYLIINYNYSCKHKIDNMAQILVRSCARWGTASLQDKSPLIAVLHANYAAGYLWAIRDIFTDEEIKDATGINRVEFEKKIIDVQDKATKYMIEVCPAYGSNLERELARIGGE
jgi:hypothetical protein